eukprot:10534793-Karenia_brevis.AAC.1
MSLIRSGRPLPTCCAMNSIFTKNSVAVVLRFCIARRAGLVGFSGNRFLFHGLGSGLHPGFVGDY